MGEIELAVVEVSFHQSYYGRRITRIDQVAEMLRCHLAAQGFQVGEENRPAQRRIEEDPDGEASPVFGIILPEIKEKIDIPYRVQKLMVFQKREEREMYLSRHLSLFLLHHVA